MIITMLYRHNNVKGVCRENKNFQTIDRSITHTHSAAQINIV